MRHDAKRPEILLAHHLKTLKLPTFLREYEKLARQCAAEGARPRPLPRPARGAGADRPRAADDRAPDQGGAVPGGQKPRQLRLQGDPQPEQDAGAGAGPLRMDRAARERHRPRPQRHRQDPCSPRARPGRLPEGPLRRLHHRRGPRPRTDGGPRRTPAAAPAEADGRPQAPDHRRARLRAALQDRRRTAVRADQPALRARLHPDHQQPAVRRMDRDLRLRAPHRRAARPADPPRHHPRDERRQLPARPEPHEKNPSQRLTPGNPVGPSGQRALAHASYPGSARAKARAPSRHQFPIPEVVDYCAAPWLVFPPPLTPPDTLDRRGRKPAGLGHPARTPVGGVLGQALERRDDHRLNARVLDRSWRARARLVPEPIQPPRRETVAPLADGGLIHPERGGDLLALQPFGTGQHDPRPHRQRLRGLAPSGEPLKLGPLARDQDNLRRASPTCHAKSPALLARDTAILTRCVELQIRTLGCMGLFSTSSC